MIKIIEQIEDLVSNKLATFKTIFSIFKLEARLAGLSVYPLVLNICMLLVILVTLWLVTMVLVGYAVVFFLSTLLPAILFVLIINLFLCWALLRYLNFNLHQMSFEKTRAYLSPQESNDNDKLQKTINDGNSEAGQHVTKSAESGDKK